MRIGVPIPQIWTAHMAQAVAHAASHSSTPTQQPVAPLNPAPDQITTRRTSSHTFDIRV